MTSALTPLAVSHADVLRFLAECPGADATSIAIYTRRVASNVRRDMPRLEKDGLVKDGKLTAKAQAALGVMDGAKTEPRPGGVIGLKYPQISIAPTLNPRRTFEPEAIEDLALSIAEYGLLQNLIVRKVEGANGVRHVLVAGEHRLAAIGLLLKRGKWDLGQAIPCKVIEADDARHTEVALIENLKRKALAPMEEARAFQKLRDVYQVPTAEIARRIGLTQRLVQQRLQLLGLDDEQQQAVSEKRLKVEGARKLVATPKAPSPVDRMPATMRAFDESVHGVDSGVAAATAWAQKRDEARSPSDLSPSTVRAAGATPAGPAIPELVDLVTMRLDVATKALDQGSLMSASRQALHAELWEPAAAVPFLQLVLKALGR